MIAAIITIFLSYAFIWLGLQNLFYAVYQDLHRQPSYGILSTFDILYKAAQIFVLDCKAAWTLQVQCAVDTKSL